MNVGSPGRWSLAVSRSWHPFSIAGPIEPSGVTRRHRLGRDGYPFRKRNSPSFILDRWHPVKPLRTTDSSDDFRGATPSPSLQLAWNRHAELN